MSNKVKYYREMQNISQEELAKKSGVSRPIISGIENGDLKGTRANTLEKISKALGVGIGEVFFNESVQ